MITQSRMTEEEFLDLPHDGRKWELVDGDATEVPASYEHDVIGFNIVALIKPYARGVGVRRGGASRFPHDQRKRPLSRRFVHAQIPADRRQAVQRLSGRGT